MGTGAFPSPVLALRILPYQPLRWSEPSLRWYLYIYMLISSRISPEFCLCPPFSSLAGRCPAPSPQVWETLGLSLCHFLQALSGIRAALTLLLFISRDHRPLFLMSPVSSQFPISPTPCCVNNSLYDTSQPKLSEKSKKPRVSTFFLWF